MSTTGPMTWMTLPVATACLLRRVGQSVVGGQRRVSCQRLPPAAYAYLFCAAMNSAADAISVTSRVIAA